MIATAEYVDSLLSQIEVMTKELKDNESDNASLHRQLDHWQVISIHWMNERNALAQERDALMAAAKLALYALNEILPDDSSYEECFEARSALKKAGV